MAARDTDLGTSRHHSSPTCQTTWSSRHRSHQADGRTRSTRRCRRPRRCRNSTLDTIRLARARRSRSQTAIGCWSDVIFRSLAMYTSIILAADIEEEHALSKWTGVASREHHAVNCNLGHRSPWVPAARFMKPHFGIATLRKVSSHVS